MTIDDFKPQVWSSRIMRQFDRVHVAKKCTNKDYEGDLSMGASVKIVQMGDIAVSAYAANTDLAAPETLDMAGQYFPIDQGDTFHWYVDDLDKRQARGEFVSRASQRASYAFTNKTDYYLFTVMAAGAATAQTAVTIGLGAGQKLPLEQLALMAVTLDEYDVPEDGRVAFFPPWTEMMLRLDERFTGFNTGEAQGPIKGTPIGRALGFTIYKSNNLPRATGSPIVKPATGAGAYTIIAGHPDGCTFAEQIDKVEAYKPERRFGDAMKGLHIYGAKVIRPECFVTLAATRGDIAV